MTRGVREAARAGVCARCLTAPRRVYSTGRVETYCADCYREMARDWERESRARQKRMREEGVPPPLPTPRASTSEMAETRFQVVVDGMLKRYNCWHCQERPGTMHARVYHPYATDPACLLSDPLHQEVVPLLCDECRASLELEFRVEVVR